MEIKELIHKDLQRIGSRYVVDGDLIVFEWEVSKLAFILVTHEIVSSRQLKIIDSQHNYRKAQMMQEILQEIIDSVDARDQEDDL